MALLPPRYLHSVAAIGIESSREQLARTGELMEPRATAFLYAFPRSGHVSDQASGFRLWLVTCAHEIDDLAKHCSHDMLVRMNKSVSADMQTFRISLLDDGSPDWTRHPDLDVAAIPTSWQDLEAKGVRWETFAAGRNALTRGGALALGLSEGDEVYMAGFPEGWRTGKQDYPIVRHGVLAQVQGWLKGEHETFLVDGSGFPGNSGGPVVTKPHSVPISGTQAVPDSWLIGMVSERRFSPISSEYSDRYEPDAFEETADLVEVVPMDAVDQVVQLAMEREQDDA